MKEQIQNLLSQIEQEKNITIRYANESGSRAWGFPSPDSDYDIRFIYMHERDWYLSVNEGKDQITVMPDEWLDGSGWDFRKFLRLMHSSNATVFEWLHSPIVYREDKLFADQLRRLATNYFQPKKVMFHYLGIATGMLEREFQDDLVKIKKYFYVLRPVLAASFISKYAQPAPVNFYELLPLLKNELPVQNAIMKLLKQKETAMEGERIIKVKVLDDFVQREMERCKAIAKGLTTNQKGWEDINLFYRATLKLL